MTNLTTRGTFLKTCAIGAWQLGRQSRAAEDAPFPFFALCMDTHDAKKRTVAQQAELLKELGFDGAGHLWLDGLSERLATLDAAGLKLFQVYVSLDIGPKAKQAYDPRFGASMALLKGRGVSLGVLISGGKPSDPTLDGRAVELVQEMADLAAPHGVRMALYPHANNWLERVDDGVRVARKAARDNVGAMFNLCHWLKTEDESQMKPLLQAAMPHLFAVSINGADTGAEIKAKTGNWIQPLGSGSFDVFSLLKTLGELGYRGPVGLQCYGIPGDARDHLARSIAAWRGLSARLNRT